MLIGRIQIAAGVSFALALLLAWGLYSSWQETLGSLPVVRDGNYLLIGEATDQPAPLRACPPGTLERLQRHLQIDAPAGGWPGAPQAVDVFNVFSGEVMISQGERQICGNMQDARTRDSRFRAGIGMVVVPPRGSTEPIHVAWETPVVARWIPSVRLGAPSPLQQIDTLRLLIRTACIAIAIALALSALTGFFGTQDNDFIIYALTCVVLVVWQAVLSGLSGYPKPWLPVGAGAAGWLVATGALGHAVMGWVLWRMCGGQQIWPASIRWLGGFVAGLVLLALLALLAPWLHWVALEWVVTVLEHAFALLCLSALLAAAIALRRGIRWVLEGIAALLPLLLIVVLDMAGSRELIRFRPEAVQLAVTWFLIMSAYTLNRRFGLLRRQRDEMRQLADTDALTGLSNRRAGLRQLERYLVHARQVGVPLAIGFLDIDLFKQVNDRYGHDTGDAVLVAVADVLASSVRNRDDVIRIGGEEFLILLPGSRAEVALPRLEQLREKIGKQRLPVDGQELSVTVSIGLTEMRAGDDVAELLRRADNAMYQAKRGGRNRVVHLQDEAATR